MKPKQEHWAYEELRKRLAEKTETWAPPHLQDASQPRVGKVINIPQHERGFIFLMDPRRREHMDQVLLKRIYPQILEAIEGESLVVPTIGEIQTKIEDGHEWEASRVVTFLMTDPARPVGKKNSPLWYFRFTLSVRLFTYMLSSNCLISIPFEAAGSWLLDALANSRLREASAHLSTDDDEFVLNVSSGAGQPFGDDDWKRPVSLRLRSHLAIADSVDRFGTQPQNFVLRSQMIEAVTAAYGSHPPS
jgi:hypothetical protein